MSVTATGHKRFRIAAVQMKFAPSIAGNLATIERMVKEAARRRADAVLFPECATTGYACDFGALRPKDVAAALETVASLAARYRINLLVGSAVFRRRKLQNCLVVFDRLGRPIHCYAKCQLVDSDRQFFVPGNSIALFEIDGVRATAVICHERRYPELVRLAVMAGAQILFHPNAGMDALSVSRRKRGGRDGIAVRAFENAIFYVFANSVGPQGGGKWSAGDSKIVAPDERVLRLADNKNEALLVADLDLALATRRYAIDSLEHPRFLAPRWREIVGQVVRQSKTEGGLMLPSQERRADLRETRWKL
ncbi:MAG: carbon-nitrogen hydrolase family protein [Rhodopirellula sp.]|nr:carbon-nitrogen hydrolase family protein [Rhodopirellula sp.]